MLLSSKRTISQDWYHAHVVQTFPPLSTQYLHVSGFRQEYATYYPQIQNLYALERINHRITTLNSALSSEIRVCKCTHIHTHTHTVGLAKKFAWVFPLDLMDESKWTYWPTNIFQIKIIYLLKKCSFIATCLKQRYSKQMIRNKANSKECKARHLFKVTETWQAMHNL